MAERSFSNGAYRILKETLKALAAGLGCTPLTAIGLFVAGALVGQLAPIELRTPPRWLLVPAGLFPVCFGLYLRAYAQAHQRPHWLDLWRRNRQRKLVGLKRSKPAMTVEDVWLEQQLRQSPPGHLLARLLDNPLLWGWASLLAFLSLAYICLWYGLLVA